MTKDRTTYSTKEAHDDKLAKLNGVIDEYKGKPGALIPVLHEAQKIYGYLP